MNYILLISLGAAPALYLAFYYYRQDKAKPEPKGLVIKIFVLGIISTVPAIVLELMVSRLLLRGTVPPLLFAAFESFIVAALCEEMIKLFMVKQFAFKNKAFDEVMDGIVYTVLASLGFACMENILYVTQGGLISAVLRAFTAVPMHASCSGIMGYYIGKSKFASTPEEAGSLTRRGFFYAFFIHGAYDFALFAASAIGGTPGTLLAFAIIPILIISLIILRSLIKKALAEDKALGRQHSTPEFSPLDI